jgi:hypothetical protein
MSLGPEQHSNGGRTLVYTKNLEQLLRILQASRQSGLLVVEDVEQGDAPWQGQFRLVEGNVMECQVRMKANGQVLLSDDEALRWLTARGRLNWNLEEGDQLPDTLLPPLPPQGIATGDGRHTPQSNNTGKHGAVFSAPPERSGWIPRRTLKGQQISAQSLRPVEYLQVFTLVNGHNTAEGITRLLRKSPADISRILKDLQAAGLIE